jgi:hypothetical protein
MTDEAALGASMDDMHRYSERAMTYEIVPGEWDYQLERVAISLGL